MQFFALTAAFNCIFRYKNNYFCGFYADIFTTVVFNSFAVFRRSIFIANADCFEFSRLVKLIILTKKIIVKVKFSVSVNAEFTSPLTEVC